LPTEAEWEFIAKGGTLTINGSNKFSGSQHLEKIGWFLEDAGHNTHPVGGKAANELGIFDLSGNVAEWCSDWYGRTYYSEGEMNNPQGPSGTEKVIRGGSWNDYDQYCRNTSRDKRPPGYRDKTIGFRIARDAVPVNNAK
jgi:formylglycine-generating enzyme required for sulfatase activity